MVFRGWGGVRSGAQQKGVHYVRKRRPCHLCEVLEIPLIHPDARHTVENYKIEISSCMVSASPQHS